MDKNMPAMTPEEVAIWHAFIDKLTADYRALKLREGQNKPPITGRTRAKLIK